MAKTPLIRNGRLVGSPFEGIEYDIKRLDGPQLNRLNALVDKAKRGKMMTSEDMQDMMTIRKAAAGPSLLTKRPEPTNSEAKIAAKLQELKDVFQ
jgi:hypothetical protein